ncbi:ABC transporter ATP-binding protein [Streptomyces hirsutus]|uniref:ABC transporter ATP-binding protein n=1 Tax=Streptomyces hirsutus TaxID=35620 RepID=UPI0034328ADB
MNGALTVRDLTVRYGGVVANDQVSLKVEPGEVAGLIGPNGAGKTTLVDAITGFTPCTGEVRLHGRSLRPLPPHRRRASGLSRTWQSGELFTNLTVAENVLVPLAPGGLRSLVGDFAPRRSRLGDQVDQALAAVGLEGKADAIAGDLPLGQQKLVGIARALAGSPSMLLLDEPAAGLDNDEGQELGERIRMIAERGTGVLLIDHDMALMLRVSDTMHVIHFGKLIFSGQPQQAVTDPRVVEAYLGASINADEAQATAEGSIEGASHD